MHLATLCSAISCGRRSLVRLVRFCDRRIVCCLLLFWFIVGSVSAMAELVDELLRYGLFLGAIFQLVCIAAVVFVPPKEEGKDVGDSSDEDGPVGEGTVVPHRPPQHTAGGGRRSRQDRKKRR